MEDLRDLEPQSVLPAWEVNDMLNSDDDEIRHLIDEYWQPLRSQLKGLQRETYDRWLPTVVVHTRLFRKLTSSA